MVAIIEPVVCPRCGGAMNGYPALSRRDNKTEICSDCGTEEAMFDFAMRDENAIDPVVVREVKFMQSLLQK